MQGGSGILSGFPPGDYLTQGLLAQLISMVSGLFGEPVAPAEIAPWLHAPPRPKTRAERNAEGLKKRQDILRGIMEKAKYAR